MPILVLVVLVGGLLVYLALPPSATEEPCPAPAPGLTCTTLTVPRDHFAAGGQRLEVTYGRAAARSKDRRGTLVVAVGGPGRSGLLVADSRLAALPDPIRNTFDVVLFDQRGVDLSGELECTDAARRYRTVSGRSRDAGAAEQATREARAFVETCVRDIGLPPDELARFSTREAAEDLELIRQHLRADRIHIYGEGYGTELAQTYAAVHPDHVAGLILDDVRDPIADGRTYAADAAAAFDGRLTALLRHCNGDADCARDFGADALASYDALARRLGSRPIDYTFPSAQGRAFAQRLTLADLEKTAEAFLDDGHRRMLLVRALAAASDENYVPLGRLRFIALGIDPETGRSQLDSTLSDATYYAVTCIDRDYVPTSAGSDPEARARAFLDAAAGVPAARFAVERHRFLPCAYWPARPRAGREPLAVTGGSIPVIVLASTGAGDATPPAAERVVERLAQSYLVTLDGGPNVLFGAGLSCADATVTAFLVDGRRPASRRAGCPSMETAAYVPVAQQRRGAYPTPLSLFDAIDREIENAPEYALADKTDPVVIGCDRGGSLRYHAEQEAMSLFFTDCALVEGLALTGRGTLARDGSKISFRVRARGADVSYSRDGSKSRLTGTFDGQKLDLRSAPG
jgi:pimeloyl-ACP methyl ester carboxylesterase